MSQKLEWQSYDRVEQRHSPDWYWAVGIIALSLAVTAVIFNNILFAILVFVSTVVLFLRTLQKPQLLRYELTNRGLWTNKDFQPFTAFDSFWVEEDTAPQPKLLIKSKGMLTPLLVAPLEGVTPDAIRELLSEYLPEVEQHEPLSKRVMEFLGF